tara:strand:- start:714 stop:839 length:126 start_codon:yes stop_codon:yes gene_type:complete
MHLSEQVINILNPTGLKPNCYGGVIDMTQRIGFAESWPDID